MHKGLATLEIIFAMLIIAILATCAVPNAARILDRATLDYETKKFYTDMRAVQSFDRVALMREPIIGEQPKNSQLEIVPSISDNSYRVKTVSSSAYGATHKFSSGISVDKDFNIVFDDMGKVTPAKTETMRIRSQFGIVYFIITTVGRFRGSHTPPGSDDE